ncbi:MAG: type II toxin-antitoxin system VapC family toxin [Clostridia bacterium]|nr:type II toxin-antitoxin system VapC family toxin [Clostridia bacterium]
MKILLDTHILLWALSGDPRLPERAAEEIGSPENTIAYSVASLWEVETKHLAHPDKMAWGGDFLDFWCREAGYQPLEIRAEHISRLKDLRRPDDAPPHKDPFDRMLICQAEEEGMMLLTHDALLAQYDAPCILPV